MGVSSSHTVAVAVVAWSLLSACTSRPTGYEARQATLEAACPLGSTLQHVEAALREQDVGFFVMSAADCQQYLAPRFPGACAGGSRLTASVFIDKHWTGLEAYLSVTYLFDSNEQLARAEYKRTVTGGL
jgi:hypothetical protein